MAYVGGRAVATFDLESDDPADLSFQEGDSIEILEIREDGWWTARLGGRTGDVPSNFFKPLHCRGVCRMHGDTDRE